MGRNEQRLAAAAESLLSAGAKEVVCIAADLASEGAAERLHEECNQRGLEIELLVNSAGAFAYCDVVEMEPKRLEDMVRLNALALCSLCRLFGEDMARRGGGEILNISSYAAAMPWAGLAAYSATKAFVRNFSFALSGEMRTRGVKVCCAMPAGVATDLYGLSHKWQQRAVRWGILLTPERVAEGCLRALERGRRRYIPGLMNRLLLPIVGHLPRGVKNFLHRKTLRFQK